MVEPAPLLPLPGGGWCALGGGTAEPVSAPPRPLPAEAAPRPEAAPPAAARRRGTGLEALHLSLSGVALALPSALAEHIHPMPELLPLPGAPPWVRGLALAGGAPILVLDSLALAGGGGAEEAPAWLLALRWQGRRLGLPAARIAAGPAVPALRQFEAWLDGPEARAALALAPPALEEATSRTIPERHLVLFRAGGLRAALPAEAVRAVLAPVRAQSLPGGGGPGGSGFVAPHRGELLPVRDAGLRLGAAPAAHGTATPMIRLALARECLVAVSAIEGVRRVPAADITPLGTGEGLVTGLARVQGENLMLLSPTALAA
ncbi:chemotaxis protein CheW [Roseococcus suduntuyensis]|uniref:Chemotaxis signal transduction protein n=1 Tax=Roseococcus suduntuyensis TaxID=455361 RepID=A0A840AB49_9PROT|nr:chemotaxis protein CheW [Roseococcus suduntuyensis]MBB3898779.1 chemotaxis signal transduction protein [Roseococcus suduntuyensis]